MAILLKPYRDTARDSAAAHHPLQLEASDAMPVAMPETSASGTERDSSRATGLRGHGIRPDRPFLKEHRTQHVQAGHNLPPE